MGSLRDGNGKIKFGGFEGPYSYVSRFEDGSGTNPEELLGAAHAGCFSMKLSAGLMKAGFTATQIDTTARVHLEAGGITKVELDTACVVPGIDQAVFEEQIEDARVNCPVSMLFKGIDIKVTARLQSE